MHFFAFQIFSYLLFLTYFSDQKSALFYLFFLFEICALFSVFSIVTTIHRLFRYSFHQIWQKRINHSSLVYRKQEQYIYFVQEKERYYEWGYQWKNITCNSSLSAVGVLHFFFFFWIKNLDQHLYNANILFIFKESRIIQIHQTFDDKFAEKKMESFR